MPPLRQWPRPNDAFVIIQLSPTGLTPQGNSLKIWNKTKTKSGPQKISGSVGQPTDPDLLQND
jgi:hypothetical protein